MVYAIFFILILGSLIFQDYLSGGKIAILEGIWIFGLIVYFIYREYKKDKKIDEIETIIQKSKDNKVKQDLIKYRDKIATR